MKRIAALMLACLFVLLVIPFNVAADNSECADVMLNLYSQECPKEIIEYAKDNFIRFLTASIQSDALSVDAPVVLGMPFSIQTDELPSIDSYYFPLLSNSKCVGTFQVLDENGEYTASMSALFADELSYLLSLQFGDIPLSLYSDNGNIMFSDGNKCEVLLKNYEESEPPSFILPTVRDKNVVNIATQLSCVSPASLAIPLTGQAYYINLDIRETQGNEPWCAAYSAATIIRTVKKTGGPPCAQDLIRYFHPYSSDFRKEVLSVGDVIKAGNLYELYPKRAFRVAADLAVRDVTCGIPVFLILEKDTNIFSQHAVVLRGYDPVTSIYSVWNPWYKEYVTIDMKTRKLCTPQNETYTWIDSVYNWGES